MPSRPPSRCPRADCPHPQPCPEHTPAPWTGSTRRATLPKDWATRIRPAVLLRDPICRCDGCPRCRAIYVAPDETRCVALSSDCDHIDDPTDHSLTNLRGLCRPCHAHRSGQQGGRAQRTA